MDKVEFIGWLGKDQKLDEILYTLYDDVEEVVTLAEDHIFIKKGLKNIHWSKANWPPIKVRITLEVVK